MSDKPRFPYADAMKVAESIQSALAPFCERIGICGSLRRKKKEIGDIEILYVSKPGTRKLDLLESEDYGAAEKHLDWLLYKGELATRPNRNGLCAWGSKNKLAVHVASGIPVDFFATTEENWWVSLVIRTGGKDTNLVLTMGAQHLGRKLHAYGCGVTMPDGTERRAESEREVFELCGVRYQEPEKRS